MKNTLLARMREGRTAIGMGIRQTRLAEMGRLMAASGFDWTMVDMEHCTISLDDAVQLAVACQDAGVTPIFRVPEGDYASACRALDGGAMGIIMPHINTAAEAAELVQACRYPPVGKRSISMMTAGTGFLNLPAGEVVARIDPEIALFALVESAEGARNVEAIVATPGLNGILIGPQDLCLDLGIPGKADDPRVQAIVTDAIAACRKHGKYVGLGGAAGIARRYANKDMNFVLAGTDQAIFSAAAAARVKEMRELVK
jgi:4-hydroxy-2-oxoheptanedioate aldolase